MAIDPDLAHRREYDAAVANHPEAPTWDALTDIQRANIRAENKRYWRDMNALGDAIANGTPLPPLDLS